MCSLNVTRADAAAVASFLRRVETVGFVAGKLELSVLMRWRKSDKIHIRRP